MVILAYLLIGLGLIGTVVPLLPGSLLIWCGALIWAWSDGFQRVGWGVLAIMAAMAIAGMASDLIATTVMGRKAGMRWRTIGGAMAGGIVGGILLSVLPIIGTVIGAIAGALLGVVLVDYAQHHDWPTAWHAAKVYALSFLVGRLVELALGLAMVGLLIWCAWR